MFSMSKTISQKEFAKRLEKAKRDTVTETINKIIKLYPALKKEKKNIIDNVHKSEEDKATENEQRKNVKYVAVYEEITIGDSTYYLDEFGGINNKKVELVGGENNGERVLYKDAMSDKSIDSAYEKLARTMKK